MEEKNKESIEKLQLEMTPKGFKKYNEIFLKGTSEVFKYMLLNWAIDDPKETEKMLFEKLKNTEKDDKKFKERHKKLKLVSKEDMIEFNKELKKYTKEDAKKIE